MKWVPAVETTQEIPTSGVDGKLKDQITELEHFLVAERQYRNTTDDHRQQQMRPHTK